LPWNWVQDVAEPLPRFGWQKRALAAKPITSTTTLAKLFEADPNDGVKRALGTNIKTPPEILTQLAGAMDQEVRVAVARNRSTPVGAVAALTQDRSSKVRDAAANNPAISPYLSASLVPGAWPVTVEQAVSILVADGGASLVEPAGRRAPDCSSEVLAVLAHSQVVALRARIAQQREADAETLDFLARTSPLDVKSAVARNRNSSAATLDYLDNLIVGRAQYGFNQGLFHLAQTIAASDNTMAATLATLAKHGTRQVRQIVARNTSTPPQVLSALASDDSMSVVERVAGNPSAPPSALVSIAQMGLGVEKDLRSARVSATRTTAVLTELDRVLGPDVTTWGSVLAHVAENPRTPPQTLARLVEEGYGEYVARNPSASPDLGAAY
jgi:hypothetical protein